MKAWVAAYAFFAVIDLWTTLYGLSNGHPELNPIAAAVYATVGLLGITVYKVVLSGTMMVMMRRYWSRVGLRVLTQCATILVAVAAISNTVVLLGG